MKGILTVLIPITALLFFAGGCKKEAHHHSHSWGYTGLTGPANWGDLDPHYKPCKEGMSQSPIDITGAAGTTDMKLKFDYSPVPLEIMNNGHTIKVNYSGKGTLTVGEKEYKLLQFHFHAPSEGAIKGKRYDLCAHLVHKGSDGLAVVAVYFDTGLAKGNEFLKKLWMHLPAKTDEKKMMKEIMINAMDMLPKDMSFYHFMGSLTTPPCSEGVKWFVLKNPVPLSAMEKKAFTSIFPNNARPLQKLNGRKVLESM